MHIRLSVWLTYIHLSICPTDMSRLMIGLYFCAYASYNEYLLGRASRSRPRTTGESYYSEQGWFTKVSQSKRSIGTTNTQDERV